MVTIIAVIKLAMKINHNAAERKIATDGLDRLAIEFNVAIICTPALEPSFLFRRRIDTQRHIRQIYQPLRQIARGIAHLVGQHSWFSVSRLIAKCNQWVLPLPQPHGLFFQRYLARDWLPISPAALFCPGIDLVDVSVRSGIMPPGRTRRAHL